MCEAGASVSGIRVARLAQATPLLPPTAVGRSWSGRGSAGRHGRSHRRSSSRSHSRRGSGWKGQCGAWGIKYRKSSCTPSSSRKGVQPNWGHCKSTLPASTRTARTSARSIGLVDADMFDVVPLLTQTFGNVSLLAAGVAVFAH
eukprot:138195-Prymnesium_polylepis.1